ncbi:hypothetical protein Tco_0636975 [Tanacetum coccineum]
MPLTDEAVREMMSIKKLRKRNVGEPSKDKNGRDDNKRTRTENAFATTVNPVCEEIIRYWAASVSPQPTPTRGTSGGPMSQYVLQLSVKNVGKAPRTPTDVRDSFFRLWYGYYRRCGRNALEGDAVAKPVESMKFWWIDSLESDSPNASRQFENHEKNYTT